MLAEALRSNKLTAYQDEFALQVKQSPLEMFDAFRKMLISLNSKTPNIDLTALVPMSNLFTSRDFLTIAGTLVREIMTIPTLLRNVLKTSSPNIESQFYGRILDSIVEGLDLEIIVKLVEKLVLQG